MGNISIDISFDGKCYYIPSEEEIAQAVEDALLQIDIDGMAIVNYEFDD